MKLLIATGLYAPDIGGPATYVAMLEESLPAHGYELTVVPFSSVRHLPKLLRHIAYAYKLWRASRDVDGLYALDPISVGLPAMLVARLRRLPYLLRLGGDYAWEQGRVRFGVTDTLDDYLANRRNQPWRVRVLAYWQAVVAKRATQVIVPSKYLQSVVEQWGVPKEHVTVIYSALHPMQPEEGKVSLRQTFGYTTPTILSAARLVPWKGFRVLIQVVAEYKKQGRDVMLVIAGDGPDRADLEALCIELQVTNQVQLVGRLDKQTLANHIAAADVFVLNTAYEGLSHQLVEVMSIGTPIVTTTAGGNRELITDGHDGYLVPFDDKVLLHDRIAAVLDSETVQTQLTTNAKQRVAAFSSEKAIDSLDTTLRRYLHT